MEDGSPGYFRLPEKGMFEGDPVPGQCQRAAIHAAVQQGQLIALGLPGGIAVGRDVA